MKEAQELAKMRQRTAQYTHSKSYSFRIRQYRRLDVFGNHGLIATGTDPARPHVDRDDTNEHWWYPLESSPS